MATKPKSKPDTRERILSASLPLFSAHGYAGTSTRMVAAAAEVNVATLAYYFEGKEGLYNAVVQRLHEDLARAAPTGLPDRAPEDVPAYVADLIWTFAKEHHLHIRLLIRNVLDAGRHADVVMENWADALLERAVRVLTLYRPDWDRVRARLAVLGLMHTTVRFAVEDPEQLRQLAGDPDDLDEAVRGYLADHLRLLFGLALDDG